jgi:hypothetical protein
MSASGTSRHSPHRNVFGRYRINNGQRAARGPNWSAAFDPSATLAVHCGNGFFAGLAPIKVLV